MDLAMKLNDERQAGIREGKREGKETERLEIAMSLSKDFQQEGLSSAEIHQHLQHIFHHKLSDQQITKIVNQLT